MKAPGKLTGALLSSDVLVYSQNTLDKDTIANIKKIKGVTTVEPLSMGQFFVDEQEVTYAAVHPDTFRRFTPPERRRPRPCGTGSPTVRSPSSRPSARSWRRRTAT